MTVIITTTTTITKTTAKLGITIQTFYLPMYYLSVSIFSFLCLTTTLQL